MALLACAVILVSMSVAMAQKQPGEKGAGRGEHAGGGQPGGGMDGMLSQLNLDEKQQAEVAKIREEMKAEMEKAHGDKTAMRPVMQQFMSKVEAILTPEQKQKLQTLRAQHKRGGRGAGAGGPGGGEHGGAQK
jgi:Spy/CpxP family protein refolding chaperone